MKRDKFIVIGCGRFGGQVATERSNENLDVIIIDKYEFIVNCLNSLP